MYKGIGKHIRAEKPRRTPAKSWARDCFTPLADGQLKCNYCRDKLSALNVTRLKTHVMNLQVCC